MGYEGARTVPEGAQDETKQLVLPRMEGKATLVLGPSGAGKAPSSTPGPMPAPK